MAEPRRSLLDRLPDLSRATGSMRQVLDVRGVQAEERRRWLSSPPAPLGAARCVHERFARLQPLRARIDVDPERGRIVRATEKVPAGQILLAEPALVILGERAPEDPVPLPWRLVVAIARLDPDGRALVEDLHDAHAHRTERYAAAARELAARDIDLGVPPDDAGRLLGIARTNGFGSALELGAMICPAAAMLTHSCRPNCDRTVEGGTLFVQAQGDLSPGDEITISYVDTTSPAPERLALLLVRYGFVCDCPDCARALAARETDREELDQVVEVMEARYLERATGSV